MTTPSLLSATQKLWSFLTREEKWQWGKIASFSLILSCLEIATATAVMVFAQVLSRPELGQHVLQKLHVSQLLSEKFAILWIACGIASLYLIKNILAIFATFYDHYHINQMRYRFKEKILRRYAKMDYATYIKRNSSEWLTIIADIDASFSNGMGSLTVLLSEGTILLALLGSIIWINPFLATIIFGIGAILYLFLTKLLFPRFYFWGLQLQKAIQLGYQHLLQFFSGFKEIILLNKSEAFINNYTTQAFKEAKLLARQNATNVLPRLFTELLFMLFFIIAIATLSFQEKPITEMIGILGAYFYVGFRLMPGLNRIITQLNVFKSIIPRIEKVHTEIQNQIDIADYLQNQNFKFEKTLCLTEVSFQYTKENKPILQKVNLTIFKGECIGIVGQSGSGKSTLIDLILGLLKPNEGALLIDDQYPVNSMEWHAKIGYVQQTIYLTDDTIAANIAFGESPENIDRDKLYRVIRDAQLEALIHALPQGINASVGERGIRLSGGERQRIAIARALYRNPEVLIFDEATSALDNETEKQIMETIYQLRQNRTMVIIAHRISTLKHCDRILNIENSKVIEQPPTQIVS